LEKDYAADYDEKKRIREQERIDIKTSCSLANSKAIDAIKTEYEEKKRITEQERYDLRTAVKAMVSAL